ncbi:MAG: tlde1 domain-containing protein [Alphaproteobacteria bacterium]
MAYCVSVDDDVPAIDQRPSRRASPQQLLGGLALICIALACGSTLYNNLAGDRVDDIVTPPKVTIVTAQPAQPAIAVAQKAPRSKPAKPDFLFAPSFDAALLDGSAAMPPVMFSRERPMKLALHAFRLDRAPAPAPTQIVASVPLPAPRPAELAPITTASIPTRAPHEKIATASVGLGPFDQLFGKRDTDLTMSYAPSDGGVFHNGASKPLGRGPTNDNFTAVYDISARVVYMPDGTVLEAHSGLRDKLDDPRYVNVKMHGATPPHTYDLIPREALFHGVEAIRMIPVGGEDAIFGRTGLLAHSYMLGPNGDSNGCVSFRDYEAFLRAYKRGVVKRLVVVASGGRSVMTASN